MGRASKGRDVAAVTPAVILVRPQLGENIGMAARAMLNCGLSTLRLVSPRDGWPNERAQRAASGADIVLEKAEVFDSVGEAVADLERVIATTARNRELTQRILTPRHAAAEMRGWIGQGQGVGILFGPERTGLENDDMVHADTALSIPLNPQFSSLNMAQAVLLVAYEWSAAGDTTLPFIKAVVPWWRANTADATAVRAALIPALDNGAINPMAAGSIVPFDYEEQAPQLSGWTTSIPVRGKAWHQRLLLVAQGCHPDHVEPIRAARVEARAGDADRSIDHLERALDQSGFLRNKEMRPSMVLNLRALLQRAEMTEQEARTFHGVIKFLSKKQHEE